MACLRFQRRLGQCFVTCCQQVRLGKPARQESANLHASQLTTTANNSCPHLVVASSVASQQNSPLAPFSMSLIGTAMLRLKGPQTRHCLSSHGSTLAALRSPGGKRRSRRIITRLDSHSAAHFLKGGRGRAVFPLVGLPGFVK